MCNESCASHNSHAGEAVRLADLGEFDDALRHAEIVLETIKMTETDEEAEALQKHLQTKWRKK